MLDLPPGAAGVLGTLAWDDPVRLQTVICFYAGSAPLRHRPGPRRMIWILEVTEDFAP
jgi:hypothetical protein